MRASMDFKWETFPQYMDRIERLPLGINISHLFPISPAVAYVMGSFAEAKSRRPSEQETEKNRPTLERSDECRSGWLGSATVGSRWEFCGAV